MTRAIRKHLGDFLAVLVLFVMAVAIGAYILSEQRLRFPVVEEKPFTVKAELPDAQAVQPGQGQSIRSAGVEIGLIGKVELEDGIAIVDMDLEPKYAGFIREDATALLRTKTGLKDMFIEVDPGEGEPLEAGERIRVANTAPDIDPDEFLSALDADTRDYLKLLVAGAGKGLRGRGEDLRETFKRFEPLHRDLERVAAAVARRRNNLKRLIHRYGLLTTELADKDREIVRLVRASNTVFEALASEDQNISLAVARLPGALRQTESTLRKVDPFARRLGPTLDALRPAFRQLDEANAAVLPLAREGTPIVRDQIRPFARLTPSFTRDFGVAARNLARAGPDLTTSFEKLNRFFNIGAYNPNGAEDLAGLSMSEQRAREEGSLYWTAWVVENTTSLFANGDAQGPFRRLTAGGVNCSTFVAAGLPPDVAALLGSAGLCAAVGP